MDELPDGTEVFVDGAAGNIIVDPAEEQRAAARAWAETAATLAVFDGNGTTADGHPVPLLANVGGAKDAVAAAALGAQGVGLFRTEFCFLERDTEPSVEDQATAYQGVFDAFPGKKVVLRTLDAGADKPLPFLTDATESNSALGIRGYRTDFTNPGALERQLQAIAQAASASSADVWGMAPTTLTQYAMAADRQLGPLPRLNSPWQPAVLRLIQLTVSGAEEEGNGKPVGVRGEAVADPALAVVFVGLGVSTLSMTSRSLAAVGTALKSVALEQAQELARLALTAPDALDARSWVRAQLPILEELGL